MDDMNRMPVRLTDKQLAEFIKQVESGKAGTGFIMDDETFEEKFGSRRALPFHELSAERLAELMRRADDAERRGANFEVPPGALS